MSHSKNQDKKINRRTFVNRTGSLMALGMVGLSSSLDTFGKSTKPSATIRIKNVDSNFEREPLIPYRFKGSAITEGWQTAAYLESDSGTIKLASEVRERYGPTQRFLHLTRLQAAMH